MKQKTHERGECSGTKTPEPETQQRSRRTLKSLFEEEDGEEESTHNVDETLIKVLKNVHSYLVESPGDLQIDVEFSFRTFYLSFIRMITGKSDPPGEYHVNMVEKFGLNYDLGERPYISVPDNVTFIYMVLFAFVTVLIYARIDGHPMQTHHIVLRIHRYFFGRYMVLILLILFPTPRSKFKLWIGTLKVIALGGALMTVAGLIVG